MRPRIVLTRRLPHPVEERALATFDADLNRDDASYDTATLLARAANADALLVSPTERLDKDVIAKLPDRVRIIATYSVGYDHIDVAAAARRGITVTHTPDVLTESTADIAMLCLLGAARHAQDAERVLREGRWSRWSPTEFLGVELCGKTLGLYGMGRIGRAVARRARGFEMRIVYRDRERVPSELEEGAIFYPEEDAFLAQCDALSLHAPLTPETHHYLDARRIAKLKRGVVVVNTARGPLIDDAAMIEALRSGQVGAAGLDVYANEPKLAPGYLELPNVFLLPHIGSATVDARVGMGMRALDNLERFFAGGVPPHRVPPPSA